MGNNHEKSESLAVITEVLPARPSPSTIYSEILAKRKAREDQKKEKKKDGKKNKSKKEEELDRYVQYFGIDPVALMESYDPFLYEQGRYRRGNVIPNGLEMNLYSDSGFFFGTKGDPNGFIGKPACQDGHVLVAGVPGSGKTMGIVIPTLMTWRGSQIILDTKGDLFRYWLCLNKHDGKRFLLFRPGAETGCGCHYDPYAFLRQGGEDELAGNVRDLSLALIPLLPSVKEPVWIQAAQNFLTGAIHYYYSLGLTFIDTMFEIQLSSIQEIIEEIMKDENIVAKLYMSS